MERPRLAPGDFGELGDGHGLSSAARGRARIPLDVFARARHGRRSNPDTALVAERRNLWRTAAARPAAPARLLHGNRRHLPAPAHRRSWPGALCRAFRRTRAGPDGVHAPHVGHAQSVSAHRASLAGLDAHLLSGADRRFVQPIRQAGGLDLSRSRAGREPLELRLGRS